MPTPCGTALDRKVRNQVRKAEKSHLVATTAGREGLDEFYAVFARNMRDLGTPVYSPALFDAVLTTFPDRARLIIVRLGAHAGGGRAHVAVARAHRGAVGVVAARVQRAVAEQPALLDHPERGHRGRQHATLDFGRSTPNEGTFHFKKQWGAGPAPLCWEYDVAQGTLPDQSPKNPKFRLAIQAWQKLPVPVANAIGPRIVRSIP